MHETTSQGEDADSTGSEKEDQLWRGKLSLGIYWKKWEYALGLYRSVKRPL